MLRYNKSIAGHVVQFKFDTKELKSQIAKLSEKQLRTTLRRAVSKGARLIRDQARSNASRFKKYSKGVLVKNIRTSIKTQSLLQAGQVSADVGASSKAWYGRLLETGYSLRKKRRGPVIKHIPARPWLRPAFDAKYLEAVKVVRDYFKELLNRLVK